MSVDSHNSFAPLVPKETGTTKTRTWHGAESIFGSGEEGSAEQEKRKEEGRKDMRCKRVERQRERKREGGREGIGSNAAHLSRSGPRFDLSYYQKFHLPMNF